MDIDFFITFVLLLLIRRNNARFETAKKNCKTKKRFYFKVSFLIITIIK